MRLRDQTTGRLNLFCNGILQQRSAHHSAMLAEQPHLALNGQVSIEQAKGILAERNGGPERCLRRTALARPRNIKLTDLARGTGTLSLIAPQRIPAP